MVICGLTSHAHIRLNRQAPALQFSGQIEVYQMRYSLILEGLDYSKLGLKVDLGKVRLSICWCRRIEAHLN